MPTYIKKSIKILPWVTLNISKTGMSVSIGPRGAKLNIGKKGAYINSNIPGTGIYNKTKVGTSLLVGIGTCVAMVAIGYGLGVLLQNFRLFVGLCIAAIPTGIIAFFISRHFSKNTAVVEEEEVELPAERTTATKKKSSARTTRPTTTSRTGGTKRTAQRTANAPAKAYADEVEKLVEKMAEAQTIAELNKAHSEILDIMYTNIKPQGIQIFGMDFDDAMAAIEQDYAAGLSQLQSDGSATT
jgi:hypothetical protein